MPLKRPKNAQRLWWWKVTPHWWKETPDIFGVVTTQGRTKIDAEMFTFFGG
jgi:hypothetical protein